MLTAFQNIGGVSSGVAAIFAGINLAAGLWDLQSIINLTPGATTFPGTILLGVTVTNNNFNLGFGSYIQRTGVQGFPTIDASPVVRVAGPGTFFAIAYASFTQESDSGFPVPGGTMSVQGRLNARPVLE